MGKNLSLSGELADMALILLEIIKQEFKSGVGPSTLTLTQFKMLYVIKDGVRHVGQLAEMFGISQPATSKMVDSLVGEGLLRRVPHPTDRRQIELHLTAKAKTRLQTMHTGALKKIDLRLEGLSTVKKQTLARQVHELTLLLSHTGEKMSV